MRAVFVPLALVVAASGAAQTVLLRYHPPIGKTFSYTLVTSMSIAIIGSNKPVKNDRAVARSLRALAQEQGSTTLEVLTDPSGQGSPGVPTPPSGPRSEEVARASSFRKDRSG